jgi:trehalose-6-phosphatase
MNRTSLAMQPTIAVDFDHTITDHSGDPYKPGGETPNKEMIEYVRHLKDEKNYTIIIWTARPWSQASHIVGLLTMWEVPYNGVKMEKGGADCYIDDKAVNHLHDSEYPEGVEGLVAGKNSTFS